MTTVQLLIVCVTVLLLGVIVVSVVWGRHEHTLASVDGVFSGLSVGAKVVVHKVDGQSISGTLRHRDDEVLVLGDVAVITGGAKQPAAGDWTIPTGRVDCVQVL